VSGDIGSNQQRSATTAREIMGMFAFYEAMPKEKKRSLPRLTSLLDSFKTSASSTVLLGSGVGDPDELVEAAAPTYICLLICDVNVSYVRTSIYSSWSQ
jgi:hypothetical protein